MCSLLERFYDIDSGSILIDGVELKDISPAWLRREAIGYISQVTTTKMFLDQFR